VHRNDRRTFFFEGSHIQHCLFAVQQNSKIDFFVIFYMLAGLIPPTIDIKEVKNKGCTNTGCQVTMAIIFCTVVALFNIQSGVH